MRRVRMQCFDMIKDHGLRSHSLINTSGFLLSSVNRYLQIHENLLPGRLKQQWT